MKDGIVIINAEYVEGYKINDFEKQVMAQKIPEYKAYQNLDKFKTFKIDGDNIVWGENWDLIFPLHLLYNNTLDKK